MNSTRRRSARLPQLFAALLALASGTLPLPAATAPFDVHPKLVFSRTDTEQTLDLFVPRAPTQPVPCIVVIQGGGFRAQDGQRFRPQAEYLARHGFAAALISYRGQPRHRYRETIADVKAAVRFLRKIAAEHHLDVNRFGATGRSAGGTLAALLAVTGDLPDFEGDAGHPGYSSRIQAAVAYAGVFDFIARYADPAQAALMQDPAERQRLNAAWLGETFSATSRVWREISPLHHLDPTDPPMLLVHCRDDGTVPWLQSEQMHARMHRLGVPAELRLFETGGHGFRVGGPEAELAPMVEFFQRTLPTKPAR